ncbi:MAG: hypothetical protein VZR36_05780 [Prevotella sp.]|nr:hypothetical protein [Prevotella sp.]
MKQNIYGLCLVIAMLSMVPLQVGAKKKQIGQFVTYNGKVNGHGIPEGKGTLETTYGSKDILKGVFENGQVKKAVLLLNAIDKKNYKAKFEGTLKCEVSSDGKSVTYTLQSGIFYASSDMFITRAKQPFVITRTPSATECKLTIEGLLTKYSKLVMKDDKLKEITDPIRFYDIRRRNDITLNHDEDGEYYKTTTYVIDENFTPQETDNFILIKCKNYDVQKKGKEVYVIYPNNDYICYEHSSGLVIGFRKTKPEGTITFKGEPCMEFVTSANQKGTAYFEKYPELYYKKFSSDFFDRDTDSFSDLKIRTFLSNDFNDVKTQLETEGFASLIKATVKNLYASFERADILTNKLLAMEESNEKNAALEEVYNSLLRIARDNSAPWLGDREEHYRTGRIGHSGTSRARKEIALAERIKKELNEKGNKTFGFLPGQREGDVVNVDPNDGALKHSVIRRKNGTLYVDGQGKMKLVMNDGSEFTGYFKEQLTYFGDSNQYSSYDEKADVKLLFADEFTPFDGHIKYADGTTEEIVQGEKKSSRLRREQQKEKDAYNTLCKKFGKRYVDAAANGQMLVGMPENLMVATFKAQLYGQSGSRKTYRIYGYGTREFSDEIIISNDHLLMTVWVSGGKVTSFRKWK